MALITINADGSVEFTRKPELLALFEGERKQIDRMTDILHHPETDRYYFKFLTGPFAGRVFDTSVYSEVDRYGSKSDGHYLVQITNQCSVPAELILREGDIYSTWTTSTYEDCAKLEVWFVDWMRRIMGESMAVPEARIPSLDELKANASPEEIARMEAIGRTADLVLNIERNRVVGPVQYLNVKRRGPAE